LSESTSAKTRVIRNRESYQLVKEATVMNSTKHKDFDELRFLLHGNRDQYKNEEILYTIPLEENRVWKKVARKVLDPWRIISTILADNVPRSLWATLNIKEIKPRNIIAELSSPRLITVSDFKSSEEREEILREICLDEQDRQQLWQGLALHETVDSNFISIDGKTYLENPNFDFDKNFQGIITLIKRSDTQQQKRALERGWIAEWTPQRAIAVALNQPQPQRFCTMLLNLLHQADKDLLSKLKKSEWLPLAQEGVIAPENVVFLSSHLSKKLGEGLEEVFRAEKSSKYVSLSMLSSLVQNNVQSLEKVCSEWKHETKILQFLLKETANSSNYCEFIIKTLKFLVERRQTIGKDNLQLLNDKAWMVDCNNRAIKPEKIIYFPPLQNKIKEILEQVEPWDYVTPEMVKDDISFCSLSSELQSLFLTDERAIKALGYAIYYLDEYYIGKFNPEEFALDKFLDIFNTFEGLPVLGLAQKISKEAFQKYILLQALEPIGSERLVKIFQWLAKTYETLSEDAIAIYNQYLRLACPDLQKLGQEILPNIKLLNQCGRWKSPNELCDAKKYTGIDGEWILREDQREILTSWLDNSSANKNFQLLPKSSSVQDVTSSVDDTPKSNAKLLEDYFRPWLSYIPSEANGGFLCLLAGTDPEIEKLATYYLRKRNFDNLRNRLLWSNVFKERNFSISIQHDETLQITSLLGSRFNVKNLTQDRLTNLFIGELNKNITQITLINFRPEKCLSDGLSEMLLESAKFFLKRMETQTNNESLDEIWKDIYNSTQRDILFTRNYLLKNLPHILATLGVKNQQITKCLADGRKLDYYLDEPGHPHKNINFLNQINDSINKIKSLVETDETVKKDILDAVRKKIGQGQYGYNVGSIPFELFQNADDSLVELKRILGNIDVNRQHYVLEWDSDSLTLMHWGRPLNLFIHPDARNKNFEGEGFDQDLLKMLSFNISDKSECETGKFGLGFKTVHLISKEPKVISGNLNFAVQAGLLPLVLPRCDREQEDWDFLQRLRNRLKSEQPSPDITDGTLIHLEIDPETNTNVNDVVNEFESKVGLLLVFAKFIKTCKLIGLSSPKESLTWNPTSKNLLGISGIEFGQVKILQVKQSGQEWVTHKLLCFRIQNASFAVQEASFAIVLPENLSSKSSPLSDFPTFWVTAPTKEKLGLSFVINAKFDVTTGRTSLDRNSIHNQKLAKAIGEGLGEKLGELFNKSQGSWETLRQSLKLKHEDEYGFWEFLWNVLVVDWLKKSGDQTIMQIVQTTLGGKNCSIGYLISSHAALPNGLYGHYRELILLRNINYIIEGLLSKKEYFEKVVSWQSFQKNCPSKCAVHNTIWQYVEKLIGTTPTSPKKLCFADVLAWELGNKNISPNSAFALGGIITSDFVKNLPILQREECDRIKSELNNICFESEDSKEDNKQYITASRLLIKRTNREEESLLAAFAPNDRLLHRNYYVENSLEFFQACRKQRETVELNEMVHWALAANTDAKKQAVREYLLFGDRRQTFASELRNSIAPTWMENDQGIQEILKVNSQQEQIERTIKGEFSWVDFTNEWSQREKLEIGSENILKNTPFNINKILKNIYGWWESNHITEISKYNDRLYPINIDELKQKLEKRDRGAWLILFFLGTTHRMGRTKHEQHKEFIKLCLQKNWWETFSTSNPQAHPAEWMDVLNDYTESVSDLTTWNYWMEKFPSIYRIASYLDAYMDSFCSVEKIQNDFDLDCVIAPRSSPIFQGGGFDAPRLPLGIGANFVVRELVRLGIVQANEYVIPHCFVPRANVRKLLTFLGCDGLDAPCYKNSKNIYRFLRTRFNELDLSNFPTFQNAFDIPFELYSEDCSRAQHLNLNEIYLKEDYNFNEEEDS